MNDRKPGPEHGLTRENLLSTFPAALCRDISIAVLAEGTAELLARRPAEIDRLRIYPVIDRLPEDLLDILAYDFKVDWYNPDYTVGEKRRTLKDSWRVHKLLGTKAAVETAIRAIFPDSTVEEWFTYGGEAYHFRLRINATEGAGDAAKRRKVLAGVEYYKSLRSHSDGVTYLMRPRPVRILAGGAALGSLRREAAPPVVLAAGPAKGAACVPAGGGIAGLYGRAEARLPMPDMPRHGGRGQAAAGGACVWKTRRMTAYAAVPAAVIPVRTTLRAGASAGLAGMYQKMTRRIPIYGTLE